MVSPGFVLEQVLNGDNPERRLLAPLLCAVAGEVEGLMPRSFLRNPTKIANILKQLQGGLGFDLVVPESGAFIELEALGVALDWSNYPPKVKPPLRQTVVPANLEQVDRIKVLLDTIARLKIQLNDRAAVAVVLSGPQRLVTATGGALTLSAAAELLLAVVRLVCSQGVQFIWLMEDEVNLPDKGEWFAATAPIWGTIRFYRAVPALHLAGTADHWLPIIELLGNQVIPCIDPLRAPNLAGLVSQQGIYGAIAVPGEEKLTELSRFTQQSNCLLLTSSTDWIGHIPVNLLSSEIKKYKGILE